MIKLYFQNILFLKQFGSTFYLIFQQYVPFFFSGCFRQSVVGRRLASKHISKSWTAYTLEECKQFCANETSLYCSGFAYRKVTNQREILNCDLSEKNTSQLDAYNNEHFIVNAVTDFYDRFNAVDTSTETGSNNCKNSLNHSNNQKIDTTNTSKLKIIGKTIINMIANFCFNEKIIDYNSGLRVFNKNKFTKHSHIMSNRFSLTTSMTITFLNENYEIKFHKIKYEERSGKSKLGIKDFFKFLYTIFSLLFYYKPFKIIIPLILPLFSAFVFFLINDIYSGNITDKTILLFNFSFFSIILLFVIDRINKLK